MKWYQAVPDPLPDRRVWVQWNGLIEAIPVREGRYGVAMLEALDRQRNAPAFGWLEWDVAPDNDDLLKMESFAKQIEYRQVVTCHVPLYPVSTGGSQFNDYSRGFSCVVFPTAFLFEHRESIAQLRYPTADADFFKLTLPAVCQDASPKHLHQWV